MSETIYPESWSELKQVPNARAELITSISDVASWNDDKSVVKTMGASDLIGFLFDDYRMDTDCTHLVGQLIFPDEHEHRRVRTHA